MNTHSSHTLQKPINRLFGIRRACGGEKGSVIRSRLAGSGNARTGFRESHKHDAGVYSIFPCSASISVEYYMLGNDDLAF